jgi:hypothetical protein
VIKKRPRMKRTPRLPKCIRGFKPSRCPYKHKWCLKSKNIYELPGLENERKLFGTEQMVDRDGNEVKEWRFGDWNCDLLLLMQDAAPVDDILARVQAQHPDPISARNFWEEPNGGGARTNRNLHNLARGIECRKLVGSALVGILKPSTKPEDKQTKKGSDYSNRLKECPYVRAYCKKALEWVIKRTSKVNLKTVACLGDKSFDFVSEILELDHSQRRYLDGPILSLRRLVSQAYYYPNWATT